MASDHITDAQIDAFFNEWFCDDNWRQGVSADFIDNKILALRAALLAADRAAWREVTAAWPPYELRMQDERGFVVTRHKGDGADFWIGESGHNRGAPRLVAPMRPLPPAPETQNDP